MRRALAPIAVAICLAAPADAVAAPTCDLGGSLLEVSLGATNDRVSLDVQGTEITVVPSAGPPIACTGGTPTRANTDTISVHNAPGLAGNRLVVLDPTSFIPGATPEPGDDEIEIFVNFNDGAFSSLDVLDIEPSEDHIVLGSGGINVNATGFEDQPDADIVHIGTPIVRVDGGYGLDVISAQGGRGTGSPVARPLQLLGGADDDLLEGGNGPDALHGHDGADVLSGFGGEDLVEGGLGANTALEGGDGDDSLVPGAAADPVDGGPGEDTLHYASIGAGVSVSLEGTNVEILNGTQFDDVLVGTGAPDLIQGFAGADAIDPRGGADTVDGGAGADALQLRDGGTDTAECASGVDSVTTDAPGIDDLSGCELLAFPPAAPGGDDPGPGPAATFGTRTRVTLALARKRARRTLLVRVANANPFAVTGRLSARRVKARSFRVAANARATVRLRLPKALVRRRVRLTATVRDPAGNRRVVRKTVAQPRRVRR